MSIIELWVVFALLSVICKTWFYILQKKYLDDNVSPYTTAYISSVYGVIFTVPLAVIDIIVNGIEITLGIVILLILFGIAESIYMLTYLFALKNLNISIASPIKKSKPVFVGIAEPIILAAQIPFVILLAALGATVGGVLSVIGSEDSIDSYRSDLTKIGLLFALLTLIFSVGMSLISRYGSSEISPFVFGAGITVTMTIVTKILLYQSDVDEMQIKLLSRKGTILGTVGAFRSIFVWVTYSLVVATAATTVTQFTLVLDVLLAKFYLGEKVTKTQWIGVSLIFIAIITTILLL